MRYITVMIVDDEQLVLDNLKYLLLQYQNIRIVCETTDPNKALEAIQNNLSVDVVFMDVSMPEMDGIEVAKKIYFLDPSIKIIFLTAYEEYALPAFEVNTVDYILKPITLRRLSRSLNKLDNLLLSEKCMNSNEANSEFNQLKSEAEKFVGLNGNKYYLIDFNNGYYLKMEGRNLMLYTKDQMFYIKHGLNYWEKQLEDKNWIRCNRACMVNINHIQVFTPMFNSTYSLRMENRPEEISVNRTYLGQFKKLLNL